MTNVDEENVLRLRVTKIFLPLEGVEKRNCCAFFDEFYLAIFCNRNCIRNGLLLCRSKVVRLREDYLSTLVQVTRLEIHREEGGQNLLNAKIATLWKRDYFAFGVKFEKYVLLF